MNVEKKDNKRYHVKYNKKYRFLFVFFLSSWLLASCAGPESGYQTPPSQLPTLNAYPMASPQADYTYYQSRGRYNGSSRYGTFAMYKVGNPYYIKGTLYRPHLNNNYNQVGVASWYGPHFQGKKLAAGGIFDMNKISAAHKTLPLPSLVLVTNLENGRSLRVLVNDRGPYAKNRIIDLSKRAAEILGYKNKGTTRVRVRILPRESQILRSIAQSYKGQQKTVPSWMVRGGAEPTEPEQQAVPYIQHIHQQQTPPPHSLVMSSTHVAPTPTPNYVSPGGSYAFSENEVSSQKNSAPAKKESKAETNSYNKVLLPYSPAYYIQTGAYSRLKSARTTYSNMLNVGHVLLLRVRQNGRTLYKVRVGPYRNLNDLLPALKRIKEKGYKTAIVKLTR